jgi:hypothetical protein
VKDWEVSMKEIEDRRQSAREAAYDAWQAHEDSPTGPLTAAIEAAIEVCTQVQLTDEVVYAAAGAVFAPMPAARARHYIAIRAAFTEAGFEVVP